MKKKYSLLLIIAIFLLCLVGLFLVEIPSPSKFISENYELEIK